MSLANQLPRLNTPPQVGGLSKYHRSVSKARGRITLWGCADRTVNSNSHGDVYFACLRASGQSWLSTSEWSIIYIAAGRNSFSIKVVSWRRSLSSFLCRPISCVDFFFFFLCRCIWETTQFKTEFPQNEMKHLVQCTTFKYGQTFSVYFIKRIHWEKKRMLRSSHTAFSFDLCICRPKMDSCAATCQKKERI